MGMLQMGCMRAWLRQRWTCCHQASYLRSTPRVTQLHSYMMTPLVL